MNKKTKERFDKDSLPPKPPELLQNLKWLWVYGRRHWKIVTIAVVIIGFFGFIQSDAVRELINLFVEEDKQPAPIEPPQPPNTPRQLPALRVTFVDGYTAYVELTVQVHLDAEKILFVHSKYGSQTAAVNDLLSAIRGNAIAELEKHSLANARTKRREVAEAIVRASEADMERTGHIIDSITLGEIEVSQ